MQRGDRLRGDSGPSEKEAHVLNYHGAVMSSRQAHWDPAGHYPWLAMGSGQLVPTLALRKPGPSLGWQQHPAKIQLPFLSITS